MTTMPDDRLARQVTFLMEADKLKTIIRQTPLVDSSRRENSAEHSWHLVLAAMVIREYMSVEVNLLHALEMMAVHDLVEIDAGDTFAYDVAGQATKAERERAAADRIFGLLPADQSAHFRDLWEEFEAQKTPESRMRSIAFSRSCRMPVRAGEAGGLIV
jgi:putative hydrolases of HD superfamily